MNLLYQWCSDKLVLDGFEKTISTLVTDEKANGVIKLLVPIVNVGDAEGVVVWLNPINVVCLDFVH